MKSANGKKADYKRRSKGGNLAAVFNKGKNSRILTSGGGSRHMFDQWSADEAAVLIESIAAVAVVIGLIFGLIQLKQSVRNRKNAAAVDIVRTVQTQEVRLAIRKIFDLPFNADPDFLRKNPDLISAALAVDSACEMWGCMVFEGVVDHRMLDRMVGGWIRVSWERLGCWVESERDIAKNQNIGEWWQWIYEVIEADPDPGKV